MLKRLFYIIAFCGILALTGVWFYFQVDKNGPQYEQADLTASQVDNNVS